MWFFGGGTVGTSTQELAVHRSNYLSIWFHGCNARLGVPEISRYEQGSESILEI